MRLLLLLLHVFDIVGAAALPPVVFSVNCGGDVHVDSLGVRFEKDYSTEGEASAWGARHPFATVHAEDRELYQVERWSREPFSYEVNIPVENAEYTLDFRFSEVFFDRAKAKVFHVLLNRQPLISNLDVFEKAGGRGKPYDTLETFKIEDGSLIFHDVQLEFDGTLELTFSTGPEDNPKCNAFALFLGPPSDVPRPARLALDPPRQEERNIVPEEEEEWSEEDERLSEKYGSGPRVVDPYQNQDPLESLWPLLVVIPCLIPVVYLLVKMK